MHSAFNSSSQFLGPFLGSTSTREHPSGEVLIGLAFSLIAVTAVAMTRGRLGAFGSKGNLESYRREDRAVVFISASDDQG
jgi:hypothetical protein